MDPYVPKTQQIDSLRWVLSIIPLAVFIRALDRVEREGFMSTAEHNSLVTVANLINSSKTVR